MFKKITVTLLLGLTAVFVCGAGGKSEKAKASEVSAAGTDTDTSYAFGVWIGSELAEIKQLGITFDYDALTMGLRDILEGQNPKLTLEEASGKIQAVYAKAVAKKAQENNLQEQQFLAENGKKPGVLTTASGLQYEVISEGRGAAPVLSDRVLVNYEGALIDGTVFDSSYTSGEPVEFGLSDVIPGWTEGLQLMREGGSYRLFIPSSLAYGEQGAGGFIPPYSTLIFRVELISIVK
ncbi:MAG: FKBP-type peptidyl-prolyl cis-trans isomerase [Treponema sp.]|jgi:FKBP-type peptidyl-prolyl cis-trans isomerase FkpA|nr:FKBP-type peptidyl-prolyl cis-trans isomerase [Treponema sp.]